jgi:hypothetical protein
MVDDPLDVVSGAGLRQDLEDFRRRELLPVRGLGEAYVVRPPDLVQVHERVGATDDLQRRRRIEHRLQAHPGENSGIVKDPEDLDAVGR